MEHGELHIELHTNASYFERDVTVYAPEIVNATRDLKGIRELEITPKIMRINKIAFNNPEGKEYFNTVKITDYTKIGLGCRLKTDYLEINNGSGKAMKLIRHFAKYKCLKIIFVSGKMLTPEEEQTIIGKFGVKLIYSCLNDERLSNNSLNIDSEEFLIENGVLRKYRGNAKNVVIPYGTVRIGVSAFSAKNIESVEIPDTVVAIESWAFANNNLKTIKIPSSVKYVDITALDGNPIDEVYISTNTTVLNGRISDPEFKNKKRIQFYISYQGGNFSNFLKTLFNNLDNFNFGDITVLGNNISRREKDQIKSMFTKYNRKRNYNEQVTISYSSSNSSIEKEFKKDSIVINIYDKEIKSLLEELYSFINLMNDNDKNAIISYIEDLIREYKNNILKYNPDVNFETEIVLTTCPKPSDLRTTLLDKLYKIKNSLFSYERAQKFLIEINEYKSLLENISVVKLPNDLNPILNKIKVILIVAREHNCDEIILALRSILDITSDKLSSMLVKTVTEDIHLTLKSSKDDFTEISKFLESSIDELLRKSASFSFINSIFDCNNNSELTFLYNRIKKIIVSLDSENKEIFEIKLKELKNRFGYGTTLDKDALKSLYEELLKIIKELQYFALNSIYFKNIIDGINSSLNLSSNPDSLKNCSAIFDTCKDINILLSDNQVPQDKKIYFEQELIDILNYWKELLLNTKIEEIIAKIKEKSKEPIFNEAGEILGYKNRDYDNFNDCMIIELAILNDLNRLITKITCYKDKKRYFLELKRTFNL